MECLVEKNSQGQSESVLNGNGGDHKDKSVQKSGPKFV